MLTDQPLSPAAHVVDRSLIELDKKIDWLHHLSPTGNHERWRQFKENGFTKAPELTYPEIGIDLDETRKELLSLPTGDIERPLIAALLKAKQRELDLQIELLQLRETAGFVAASIDLFGRVRQTLIDDAEVILKNVEPEPHESASASALDLANAAERTIERWRGEHPDLPAKVIVIDDLNSMMMVNHGDLYIDSEAHVPASRVKPLIAHEVGIHVSTRYNGFRQPLRLLEVGTAHYDSLQEGLGTFAEYLAGYLPPSRLRALAARVIACDMAVDRASLEEIFDALHNGHGIAEEDAFDIAVRAKRGGGLTKDACYLGGLRSLLNALANDQHFETLLCGKFDLGHISVVEELIEDGTIQPPTLIPDFLAEDGAKERLGRARATPVTELYQKVPAA